MKRVVSSILAAAAIMVLSGTAMAVPQYYTFTGTVTQAYDVGFGSGLDVGDAVSYTFLVDRAADGSRTVLGTLQTYNDVNQWNTIEDYFHVSFVSGSAFDIDSYETYNVGYDYLYPLTGDKAGVLAGSAGSNVMAYHQIYNNVWVSASALVAEWTVGMSGVDGGNVAIHDPNGWLGDIRSTLTLTSITDAQPVPEPGTLLLLSSGLAGLAAFRKRFVQK